MQKVRVPINSFQYGEISDSLIMRTDSPVYGQSAQRLENLIVMSEGSVKKRTGLKHIYDYGITFSSTYPEQSHLYKFIFDDNEEYVISIEHQKVRCFQLETNGNVTLVQTLTTDVDSAALPFDQQYLQEYTAAQYGDVMFISHPLFAPRMLIRTSLTSFEVDTYSFDARADNKVTYQPYSRFQSSSLLFDPSAISGSITAFVYYNVTAAVLDTGIGYTPWTPSGSAVGEFGKTGILPEARQIVITPSTIASRTHTINGTNISGTSISETINTTSNSAVTSTKYFKTVTSITTTSATGGYRIDTGVKGSPAYFSSGHVGTIIRYHQQEIEITAVTDAATIAGTVVDTLSARLSVLNPLRTRDGSSTVEVTQINHGLNVGDAITVQDASATGGINSGNLNVTDQVREIIDDNTYTYQAGGSASSSEDGGGHVSISCHAPTTTWDEQSFSAVRGYPAAVVFHENRLCFGGTLSEPDTIWMSKIGSFFNFDVGEAADDDSINLVAATGDSHEIRYMISNRDLQVFTSTGELYVPTYLNQAITPTNAQIRMQTPYGTEFVAPTSIDGATIFVQKNGRIIREYLYSDSEDAYTASAISTLASHLIDSPKYLSVAHSGFNLADSYAAFSLTNGDLILFTSNRAEKRAAWTRVSTSGNFGSVIAIHSRLFANVYDSNGKLHLCEFDTDRGLDLWQSKSVVANKVDASDLYSSGDLVDVYGYASSSGYTYLNQFTVDSNDDIDLSAYATPSTVNYTVTVVNDGGNKYAIAGISGSAPTLSFSRGNTYVFDLSDSSNSGHPFAFRTSADASYTTGVTTTGTAGQAGAKVTIVVASDAPASLKYYCTVHGNSMGNTIAVSDFVNTYESAEFGKKFTAKLVSNPIDANMGNGPSTGTSRGITNIVVDVKSTDSMKVNSNDVIASSFTGKKEVKTLGYNRNPQITIEQDKPLGLQINGIVAELIV